MGRTLGDLERVVLLAVLRLGDGAYGAELQREIRERTGRDVTPGTIYPTLDRLEQKRLVRSWMGESTPERGGRSKRHYAILPEGTRLAARAWAEITSLADGLEPRLRAEVDG